MSNASAFYAAIGQEPPSEAVTYFLMAYPWLFLFLIALSVILLLAGVLRLVIKTRAKGRRLMLFGVSVLASAVVYQFLAHSPLDPPSGLLNVFLPKALLAAGAFLFLLGFARMAWWIRPDS
jgi:phosphoglycerol transferase MdoB-like AlkP superfamily enzyme